MAGELNALSLFLQQPGSQTDDTGRLATQDSSPLSVRQANLEAASISIDHQVEDLVQISGRVPVTRDENGGLTLREDGTYEFNALAVHRESLHIEARIDRVNVAQVEGGNAGTGGNLTLRQVLENVRDGFGSILSDLRDALANGEDVPKATRMTVPSPPQGLLDAPARGLSLNPGTRRMLNGYLDMLHAFREQFGNNEHIDKAIASLEEYLNESDQGGDASTAQVIQSESLSISLDIEVTTRTEINVQFDGENVKQRDPLVIDLDGDGVEVSSVADGVQFDIDGDGQTEKTAFATGGDGMLALDRNGDGVINSGLELFGDQNGAANGFAELAKFDDNQDGRIDHNDSAFDALRIWRDDNRDGLSQDLELLTLQGAGIQALYLANQDSDESVNGNRLAQVGAFQNLDGSRGAMADVLLNYLA